MRRVSSQCQQLLHPDCSSKKKETGFSDCRVTLECQLWKSCRFQPLRQCDAGESLKTRERKTTEVFQRVYLNKCNWMNRKRNSTISLLIPGSQRGGSSCIFSISYVVPHINSEVRTYISGWCKMSFTTSYTTTTTITPINAPCVRYRVKHNGHVPLVIVTLEPRVFKVHKSGGGLDIRPPQYFIQSLQ